MAFVQCHDRLHLKRQHDSLLEDREEEEVVKCRNSRPMLRKNMFVARSNECTDINTNDDEDSEMGSDHDSQGLHGHSGCWVF
jgi:hypothetical protein